jgi:pimeloyl-ACP methyl ester carboxylesterase
MTGSGPLILLFHGLAMSWQWWTPTLRALEDRYTLCAVDLPGSGESSPLERHPNRAYPRLFVEGLIEALGTIPAVIVGHSLGGYVAAQAAIDGASDESALLLVDPGGFSRVRHPLMRLVTIPVVGEVLIGMTPITTPIIARSFVHRPQAVTAEMLQWANISMVPTKNQVQILQQLRLAATPLSIIQNMRHLRQRTLIVWGRHDPVFPVGVARKAADLLGAPAPAIFEQSGHWPQLEEQTKFNQLLSSFASSQTHA